MAQAKNGDKVKVHYTGTLEDGSTFDTSVDGEPFEFTIGENSVIPGFEEAVIGLEIGGNTDITIPSEEAYGDHKPEMINEVGREALPDGLNPEVGMMLQAGGPNGEVIPVKITEVKDKTVTLDANHPMAGKTLNFNIELIEII